MLRAAPRPPRPRRPPRRALAVAALASVAVLGAACTDDGASDDVQQAAATATSSSAVPATTTTVPADAGPGDVVAECGGGAGPCVPSTTTTVPASASTTTTAPSASTTIAASSVTAPDGARDDLRAAVFWTRPYGEARELGIPGYTEPTDGTHPFVLYASVTNTGTEVLDDPAVVVTFLSTDAVLTTARGRALVPGTGDPAGAIQPGESLDAVVVVDDPELGPALAGARTTLWGVAS